MARARKLNVAYPVYWDHHRGGWRRVVELISDELGTPGGVRFVSAIEDELFHRGPVVDPWVGFVHQVPHQDSGFPDIDRLVSMPSWRWSMKSCLGLWVLTEYQRRELLARGVSVPIAVVRYPIELPVREFTMEAFDAAPPRLVFVGEFLRDYQAFYDLHAPGHEKLLLAYEGFDPAALGLRANESVRVEPRCPADQYDELLASSVVFVRLFDAVAATTVVECLARATPIVVNRVGAVTEYLGEDYPLLYDTLDEAAALVADRGRIEQAHHFLRLSPVRAEITEERFLDTFCNTAVYRSLPTPEPERAPQFRSRDLSVVMCAYQRVETLRDQLKRFAEQDFDGWFELILWNNNDEAKGAVDEVASEFYDDLDLKVIHSSENYYCGIRLAVPPLMRSDLMLICDDDVLPEPGYVSAFMEKLREHGPRAAVCARGHEFLPHELDEDRPDLVWEEGRHIVFHDESVPDRRVHFMHADNCLIPKNVLLDVARYPMPRDEYVLVDDYWMSYVLDRHLGVPMWKCRLDDVLSFTEASEDPMRALFHNPRVRDERVSFYVHHMREGWPFGQADGRRSRLDREDWFRSRW